MILAHLPAPVPRLAGTAAIRARLAGHQLLVGMDIVGKIPVRRAVLLAEAIAVDGSMHGPRMNLYQRIILINHPDLVGIVFKKVGK